MPPGTRGSADSAVIRAMDYGKATLWEVSRGGDLYLILGAEESCILVSSKVMSLGSPVFAKMLESNFIEGISNQQGPGKYSVTLADDNEAAMVLLC